MTRYEAVCEHVEDGDTFRTAKQKWIWLARVHAPAVLTTQGAKAKRTLGNLILGKSIKYEQVDISHERIVAEVWIGTISVNDYMRRQGYDKP